MTSAISQDRLISCRAARTPPRTTAVSPGNTKPAKTAASLKTGSPTSRYTRAGGAESRPFSTSASSQAAPCCGRARMQAVSDSAVDPWLDTSLDTVLDLARVEALVDA